MRCAVGSFLDRGAGNENIDGRKDRATSECEISWNGSAGTDCADAFGRGGQRASAISEPGRVVERWRIRLLLLGLEGGCPMPGQLSAPNGQELYNAGCLRDAVRASRADGHRAPGRVEPVRG